MSIPAPREADVLRACLAYLKHMYPLRADGNGVFRGICAWRSNNAGVRRTDPKTGRQWHQFTGLKGVADILGVLAPSGRLLAIECKRPGGKLSPEQEQFLDVIRQAGGLACVVRSVDELAKALTVEGY